MPRHSFVHFPPPRVFGSLRIVGFSGRQTLPQDIHHSRPRPLLEIEGRTEASSPCDDSPSRSFSPPHVGGCARLCLCSYLYLVSGGNGHVRDWGGTGVVLPKRRIFRAFSISRSHGKMRSIPPLPGDIALQAQKGKSALDPIASVAPHFQLCIQQMRLEWSFVPDCRLHWSTTPSHRRILLEYSSFLVRRVCLHRSAFPEGSRGFNRFPHLPSSLLAGVV